ncbi:MAG TPA: ROK family protein [Planctomycetota bacterium]|nr:ROK family protein [Planctomycetota bacterium]
MAEKAAVGIDLGGTKLAGALVSATGEILARREEPTRKERGPDAVVASMAALVVGLEETARKLGCAVIGTGVGAPGPIDPETGVVWAMPNMGPEWTRYPVTKKLQAALPGHKVEVENDANAAMQGEAWIGAAAGVRDAILLTLGTGVGGGIVASGQLIRGWKGVGAELGHMIVERNGRTCGCGGRGCLEQYASGTAVGRAAAEAVAKTPSGALSSLGRVPDAHDAVAAARAGDELASRVLREAGTMLGSGIVSMLHALNPRVVVIGGGFGNAAFDLLIPHARAEIDRSAMEASREGLEIVRAKLGPDAGVVGAARSVLS